MRRKKFDSQKKLCGLCVVGLFLFLAPSFFGQRPAFSTEGLEALKVEFWPTQRLEVAQASWLLDTFFLFQKDPLEAEKSRCKDKAQKIQKYWLIIFPAAVLPQAYST